MLTVFGLLLACLTPARGEHRVALLIDNTKLADKSFETASTDLEELAEAFGKFGIHSVVKRDLHDAKQIRMAIEDFAGNTPTASTAVVYFAGLAAPGNYNGEESLVLVGTDSRPDRGHPLNQVVEALSERGGSRLNMVIVDSPRTPSIKQRPPAECLVAFNDHKTLVDSLRRNEELIAAICDGAVTHESAISQRIKVTGQGSRAISRPDQFAFGRQAGDEWVDRRGAVFVWCPPGRFVKGSPPDEPGRYPDETQEEVVIEKGFWISKYEMTLSENLRGRPLRTIASHKNHPLTMVHYDDLRNMTEKTMTQEAQKHAGLPKDWQYSLPSEEQWEYAARAGTNTMYYFGNDASLLTEHANFADKTWFETGDVFSLHADRTLEDGAAKLARVGSYQPNPWGLHDIHGNVAEWCIGGAIRGGSWISTPSNCRIAFRQNFSSRNEQNFIGYRLVIQKIPQSN